jgi:hypothetical protein
MLAVVGPICKKLKIKTTPHHYKASSADKTVEVFDSGVITTVEV